MVAKTNKLIVRVVCTVKGASEDEFPLTFELIYKTEVLQKGGPTSGFREHSMANCVPLFCGLRDSLTMGRTMRTTKIGSSLAIFLIKRSNGGQFSPRKSAIPIPRSSVSTFIA
jgi:hypothetical protein